MKLEPRKDGMEVAVHEQLAPRLTSGKSKEKSSGIRVAEKIQPERWRQRWERQRAQFTESFEKISE
jgi:hypothetical protein